MSGIENAVIKDLVELQNSGVESALLKRIKLNNQIIMHNYSVEVVRECECAVIGCKEVFHMTLIPSQVIYPKYCQKHRIEYQRNRLQNQSESPYI